MFQQNSTGPVPSALDYHLPSGIDMKLKQQKGVSLGPKKSKLKQVQSYIFFTLL